MPLPTRRIAQTVLTTLPKQPLLTRLHLGLTLTNPHASHIHISTGNLSSSQSSRVQPLQPRTLGRLGPITQHATMSSSAPGASTPSRVANSDNPGVAPAATPAESGARSSGFADSTPVTEGEKTQEQKLLEYDGDGEKTHTLDMSSGSANLKLDHLGPLVVHKDGTVSRIANWNEMAEIERQNTLRILGKRNQIRLERLRGKEGEKKEGP